MHIRDGILSPEVCLATGALATAAVGYSLRRMNQSLEDRAAPLTGMVAALVFAGQMVNFPLFGLPVSGHLIGGVLAAALVGPWAACVALTLVLVVQAVLFADGGLLSLGANILNMAVVGGWGGGTVLQQWRRWCGDSPRSVVMGAAVAAYLSVLAASGLFCLEFAVAHRSGPFDLQQVTWWMVLYHALIGVGEAAITGGVLSFVLARRPDLAAASPSAGATTDGWGRFVTAGATLACAVAALLAPWASAWPDGLEAVGERLGFHGLGVDRALILSDYAVPLPAGWDGLSVSLAGVVGTLVVLAGGWGLSRLLAPQAPPSTDGSHAG